MPEFRFKARDAVGKPVSGEVEAENEQQVAERLAERGLYVISVELRPGLRPIERLVGRKIRRRPRSAHMVAFLRQMATMTRAGIPIMTALEMILQRIPSPAMRRVVEGIRDSLAAGEPLSAAMEKQKVFPGLMISSVRVGEATGGLELVLMRLAAYQEMQHNLKASIRASLAYPVVIVVVAVAIALFISTGVLPKFEVVYSRADIDLPWPTRVVLVFSHLLRDFWPLVVVAFAAAVFAVAVFLRSARGSRLWDRLVLKMPIVRKFVYKAAILRFLRALELMVRSGVDIVGALDIAAGTVGNSVLEDAIRNSVSSVREGASISEAMDEAAVFEPLIVQMLKVGEETGTVDELINLLCNDYENEMARMVRNLPRIIEPLLLMVVAGLVFVLALSLFLPIFNLIHTLKH